MEKVKISGKIFHACTLAGLESFYRMFLGEKELNFSPEEGTSFFTKALQKNVVPLGRECVIEISGEFFGYYCWRDEDAQRNFGYDEFRCNLSEKPECATVYLDEWLFNIWQDDWSGREDEDSKEAETYDILYEMAEDFGLVYEKMPAIFEQACEIEEN